MAERMYSKEWFDKGDDGGVRLQGGGAGRGVRMDKRGMIEPPPTVDKARPGSGLERSKLKSDVEESKGGLHTETLGGYQRMIERSIEDRAFAHKNKSYKRYELGGII